MEICKMKFSLKTSIILTLIFSLSGCHNVASQSASELPQEMITNKVNSSMDFSVVRTINNTKFWEKIELLKGSDNNADEKIHYKGRQRDQDIVNCFGTDMPSSKYFCLHDMGAPEKLKYSTPVLLIHGANTNATRAWTDPDGNGTRKGLAQYLQSNGYRVFAITYANKHGDNFIWSSHIKTAIARIKQITKTDKVDVIGHSKGGFALRLYTSNINNGTFSYGNDVRKAIFIGTPNRGIDYSFRHPSINWALYPESDDPLSYAPLVWTSLLWEGTWKDSKELSFSGNYFPGQAQMVARWDKEHPLAGTEPDWYTSYYGGQGFVSKSPGIDEIINMGGNLIEKVKKTPVVPGIQVAVLAGNKADVPGILNENTGPSDGIVFLESAGNSKDLTAGGAKLLGETVLNLNHLELVSSPKAMTWIAQQLADTKFTVNRRK
jgi:triacylglycerol lipase